MSPEPRRARRPCAGPLTPQAARRAFPIHGGLVALFGGAAVLTAFLALQTGGLALLFLWPAWSFLAVSLAYGGGGARLLGKHPDGRIARLAWMGALPYLLLTWGVWHLARLLSREAAWAEVAPGLLLGRRLRPGEFPPHVDVVLDLTAEFTESRAICRTARVIALPILDASTLPEDRVVPVLRQLAASPAVLYVHCAQGHGRTAMVTASLLVARGDAPDAATALARVQAVRPRARLSVAQWQALQALVAALQTPGPGAHSG